MVSPGWGEGSGVSEMHTGGGEGDGGVEEDLWECESEWREVTIGTP